MLSPISSQGQGSWLSLSRCKTTPRYWSSRSTIRYQQLLQRLTLSLLSTFVPTLQFSSHPEPTVGQQGGDGDCQHVGEKHHTAEVWLSFHPAGPTPTGLQRHDEQQWPRSVTHTHTHTVHMALEQIVICWHTVIWPLVYNVIITMGYGKYEIKSNYHICISQIYTNKLLLCVKSLEVAWFQIKKIYCCAIDVAPFKQNE